MSSIWNAITGFFADSLAFFHSAFEGVFGDASWGWAIIALTLVTRILLLPLNIKQTRSMRHMQEIQPRIKAIQKKYKADRELMRTNPEKYRMLKQKQNEEMMALYKEEGVNPAGGCLPLIAQMPVFVALFSVLRSKDNLELLSAPFYFFTNQAQQINIGTVEAEEFVTGGLGSATSGAGWPGWILILLMVVTMFVTQKQMMARNTAGDAAQQQQQKIMMYVMPVFLAFISFSLPLGVLLYWVTTNIWQLVQQGLMFRNIQPAAGNGSGAASAAGAKSPKGGSPKGGSPKAGSPKGGQPGRTGKGADGSPDDKSGGSRKDKRGKPDDEAKVEAPRTAPSVPVAGPGQGTRRSRKKRSHLPGA